MSNHLIDSYTHKTVEHRRKYAQLKFATSQNLFSSNAIDVGTNLLLRVIAARAKRTFATCLDLGCGYGPLGISLAASGIATSVEMVDRDALAVDFAKLNVSKNGLTNVETHSSLGFDDALKDRYGLIVSNLPGKAGSNVLRRLLFEASCRLTSDGEFWGVVVNPLWPEIESVLGELEVKLLEIEQGPRHTVFGVGSDGSETVHTTTDSLNEIYIRDDVEFAVGKRNCRVQTSRGVDEFDGLGYSTRLLLEQLSTMRNSRWNEATVFNVSQGYVPIALRASGMVGAVHLVDRDLLALRTSERNLRANQLGGPPNFLHHQVGWLPESVGNRPETGLPETGLVVGILRGDEPRRSVEIGIETIADCLGPGGVAVISGRSTPITRMLKVVQARKDVRLVERNRFRGSSVVSVLKPR